MLYAIDSYNYIRVWEVLWWLHDGAPAMTLWKTQMNQLQDHGDWLYKSSMQYKYTTNTAFIISNMMYHTKHTPKYVTAVVLESYHTSPFPIRDHEAIWVM